MSETGTDVVKKNLIGHGFPEMKYTRKKSPKPRKPVQTTLAESIGKVLEPCSKCGYKVLLDSDTIFFMCPKCGQTHDLKR